MSLPKSIESERPATNVKNGFVALLSMGIDARVSMELIYKIIVNCHTSTQLNVHLLGSERQYSLNILGLGWCCNALFNYIPAYNYVVLFNNMLPHQLLP